MKMEIVGEGKKEGKKIVPKKKPVAKKKPVVKTKAITVQKKEIAVQSEYGALLQLAINKDLDADKLGKLIALKVQEEERQDKKDFDIHFAEMQKEFKPIVRSKKGDKGHYAPVDELVKQYGPIITKHGFSFSWNEVPGENNTLNIVMTISGYGHDKVNNKLLPEYIPDKGSTSGKYIMNSLQAEGTRSTYGYRYTFKAGFGLTETDEDTDGNILNFTDAVAYASDITWLQSCTNLEDLLSTFKKIVDELKKNNDTIGKAVLSKIYTDLKKELS